LVAICVSSTNDGLPLLGVDALSLVSEKATSERKSNSVIVGYLPFDVSTLL